MPDTQILIARNRHDEAPSLAGRDNASRSLPPPSPRGSGLLAEDALLHRETLKGGRSWTTMLRAGDRVAVIEEI